MSGNNGNNGFHREWDKIKAIHLKHFPWCVVCETSGEEYHAHNLDDCRGRIQNNHEKFGDLVTLCPEHHAKLHKEHMKVNQNPKVKKTGLRQFSLQFIKRERSRLGFSLFQYSKFQQIHHDKLMEAWAEIGKLQLNQNNKQYRHSGQPKQFKKYRKRTKRHRPPPTKDGCQNCGALHRCRKHKDRTPSHT